MPTASSSPSTATQYPWNKTSGLSTEATKDFIQVLELTPIEIKVLNWICAEGGILEKGGERAKIHWISIRLEKPILTSNAEHILTALGFNKEGGVWSNTFKRPERKKCANLVAEIFKGGSEIDIRGVEWPDDRGKQGRPTKLDKQELEED